MATPSNCFPVASLAIVGIGFGDWKSCSNKTILDIANVAHEAGAIIIPAHIDEYNGLAYCASKTIVEQFLDLPYINAVQFVHQDFISKDLQIQGNEDLLKKLMPIMAIPLKILE